MIELDEAEKRLIISAIEATFENGLVRGNIDTVLNTATMARGIIAKLTQPEPFAGFPAPSPSEHDGADVRARTS